MIEALGGGYAIELWLAEDYAGGLQRDVERELAAELECAQARGRTALTVEVHEGFVTLAGDVCSWAEKVAARRAVMRVPGVRGIDDGGVAVRPSGAESISDTELAGMARTALDADSRVPLHLVRVQVQEGRILLAGTAEHDDERAAAEAAVTPLVGAREVVNDIVVPPRVHPPHALARVEEALQRALGREARHVRVSLNDAGARLTGRVSTLALRRVLGDVPLTHEFH
jgi:osmotically-inducible protein OsmY